MAGNDTLQTTWTANFESLMSALQEAQEKAQETFDEISKSGQQAAEQLQQHTNEMSEGFKGVSEGVEEVTNMLKGFGEVTGVLFVAEQVKKLGEALAEAGSAAVQISNVSQVLGLTVEQTQQLEGASKELGVSFEHVQRVGVEMNEMLFQAQQGSGSATTKLRELGLSLGQIRDPATNLNSMFGTLRERLENTATAGETAAAFVEVFGARSAVAMQVVKDFASSEDELNKAMEGTNGLTQQQVDYLKDYAKWIAEVGEWFEHTRMKLLSFAVEGAEALGSLWSEMRSFDWSNLGGTSPNLSPVIAQIDELKSVYDSLGAEVEESSARQQAAEVKAAKEKLALDVDLSAQKVADAQAVTAAIAALEGKETDDYKAALAAQLAVEREYSQAVKALAEGSQDELSSIQAKAYDTHSTNLTRTRALDASEYQAQIKQASDAQSMIEQVTLGNLAQQEAATRNMYSNHAISAREDAAEEIALAQQKLATQMKYFESQAALYATDESKQREYLQKEQQAYQQFAMTQQKVQQELVQHLKQEWQGVTSAMSNGLSQGLSGMLEGTENFTQAMQGLFKSLVEALIDHFVQMGVEWATEQLFEASMTQTTAASKIAANAAVAATGAAASVAAIPYYGWAMAPEVAAETYAEMMAFNVNAFAGGSQKIEADQLAMIHHFKNFSD